MYEKFYLNKRSTKGVRRIIEDSFTYTVYWSVEQGPSSEYEDSGRTCVMDSELETTGSGTEVRTIKEVITSGVVK